MIRYLSIAALAMTLSSAAHADFRDPSITVLNSNQSLASNDRPTSNGMVLGPRYGSGRMSSKPNFKTQTLFEQDGVFRVGQTIVICFTPSIEMDVKLMDHSPAGILKQIFPYGGGTARAASGKEHCIGERESAVTLTMDDKSGVGKGKVYLVGVRAGEVIPDVTAADLPGGFGSRSRGGVARSLRNEKTLFEAWIDYEVVHDGL